MLFQQGQEVTERATPVSLLLSSGQASSGIMQNLPPGVGEDYFDMTGESDFRALVETIVQHLFTGKGYSRPEDWQYVNITEIQLKCGFITSSIGSLDSSSSAVNNAPSSGQQQLRPNPSPEVGIEIECPIGYVSSALEDFLRSRNLRYFYYYLTMAIPLVMLAIFLNGLAIVAVSRIREKYLRHHVLISLSISDVLLTLTLLMKRCTDPDVIGVPQTAYVISSSSSSVSNGGNQTTTEISDAMTFDQFLMRTSNNVSGAWQIGYIMSALGILCLSLDNVLAIGTPFFYEDLMVKSKWPKGFIATLWLSVIVVVTMLHVFDLSTSFSVQIGVCILMLILLFVMLASYIFTCTQAHLHQMRLAELTSGAGNANSGRHSLVGFELVTRTQFRGFLTTCLLVLSCLICWSPLVGYLLHSEDSLASAHQFFSRYLCVALTVLHLNSVTDPVTYCLRMPDIRKSLFNIVGYRSPDARLMLTNFNSPLAKTRREFVVHNNKSSVSDNKNSRNCPDKTMLPLNSDDYQYRLRSAELTSTTVFIPSEKQDDKACYGDISSECFE